jgi:amidophosphoribosyltransferase
VKALEGRADARLDEYADPSTDRYHAMVAWIRDSLGLTTLQYQRLDDMVAAIGLPRERLCTYCWNGQSACGR